MISFDVKRCVPGERCIYVITDPEDENIFDDDIPASVVCVITDDWFNDLSPWEAPGLRKGDKPFGKGAESFCRVLTEYVVPSAERELGYVPQKRALAGYSMAGLFAMYALTRTGIFSCAASCSGSLWYDGWMEYFKSTGFAGKPEYVYFSLGDREERTKNPRMARVGDCTREMQKLVSSMGIQTDLIWSQGGHFNDPEGRIRTALAALAKNEY